MIPKERARPLDQADSGTCSMYAVANATVQKSMDSGLDFNLDEIVGGLKQLPFIDIVEGNNVLEFDQAVIKRMTDKNTKKLFDLTLHISQCSVEEGLLKKIEDKEATCVLVYDLENNANHDAVEPHCVFIEKLVQDTFGGKRHYFCINSWGKENEFVVKEVDRPNNQVFKVTVTWQPSQPSSTLAMWKKLLGWVSVRAKVPAQSQSSKLDGSSKIQALPDKVPFLLSTYLEPMFTQPVDSSSFNIRVSQQRICLESAFMDGQDSIAGFVRVQNISFHKSVIIRWTINNWASVAETAASYVQGRWWEGTDQFKFKLHFGSLAAGAKLQFCLKFDCEGEHWDNNGGANYVFQVLAKLQS